MTQLVHTHVVGCFEERATPLDNPEVWGSLDRLNEAMGDSDHSLDRPIRINSQSAQTFAPWWQGLNVIANGVATLPLKVYEKRRDGRYEADAHSAYKVLHRRPNKEMGPFTFKHLLQFWAASWGNGYAYIERNGADAVGLWPLHPDTVTPFRVNGELYYDAVDSNGGRETYFASEVFHLRGPGDDGLQGKSVFKLAKDSLAVGLQAQRYGAQFFRNDAKPGVVIEVPNAVTEETAKNMLKHWERRHGGAHNASRPAFLDNGAKVSQFSMSNEDAQFLETRQFSKSEVAGWLNLPPHMVGDLSRATFSNIEQQSIDYVVNSLMPWLSRWQDECNAKLFKPSEIESGSHYAEFVLESRLRGDFLSQMQGAQIGLTCGVFNQDEIREKFNLNRLPNGLGQTFYYSQNMTPVGTVRDDAAPKDPSESPSDKDVARQVLGSFLMNELSRAYQRIGKSATRAAASPGRLQAWLSDGLGVECRTMIDAIESTCQHARIAGLLSWEAQEFAREVRGDFSSLVNDELDGEPSTLKSRIEGLTKRLAVDRPSQLVSNLWSSN